ncbi:MAG: GNAT family N-acetyltransferase [Leptolyngbya sp. PLA1]|nr:GNAT family N-acetyltransferase [Leptolyngbya sp. PLA1]
MSIGPRVQPHEVRLRPVLPDDLPWLFELQRDPEASRLAGVKPRTRETYFAAWEKILKDEAIRPRLIELVGPGGPEPVGALSIFQAEGRNCTGYWIDRRHWGRGIASRALTLLLEEDARRPIHATAARTNLASVRILTSHGFRLVGYHMGEETERYEAREVAEFVLDATEADLPIERLSPLGPTERDLDDLAALLVDAVESGAAVSFLKPLEHSTARAWWQRTLKEMSPRSTMLVARSCGRIVGTVQAVAAWAPNQPHRAEVCKMIVHRCCRGTGLGRRLMDRIEQEAAAAGFTLLTLDAKAGGAAERLYARCGWARVGEIPRYALDTDGVTPHATVIFYKVVGAR